MSNTTTSNTNDLGQLSHEEERLIRLLRRMEPDIREAFMQWVERHVECTEALSALDRLVEARMDELRA